MHISERSLQIPSLHFELQNLIRLNENYGMDSLLPRIGANFESHRWIWGHGGPSTNFLDSDVAVV